MSSRSLVRDLRRRLRNRSLFLVDSDFDKHPKVREAAHAYGGDFPLAIVLIRSYWLSMGQRARKRDGIITVAMSLDWELGEECAKRAAASLVVSGLWKLGPGGYRFHDWYQFYLPAKVVSEARREDRERKKAERAEAARQRARNAQKNRAFRARKGAKTRPVTFPVTPVTRDRSRGESNPSKSTVNTGSKSASVNEKNVRTSENACPDIPPPKKPVTRGSPRPANPGHVTGHAKTAKIETGPVLLGEIGVNGHAEMSGQVPDGQNFGAVFCPSSPSVDQDHQKDQASNGHRSVPGSVPLLKKENRALSELDLAVPERAQGQNQRAKPRAPVLTEIDDDKLKKLCYPIAREELDNREHCNAVGRIDLGAVAEAVKRRCARYFKPTGNYGPVIDTAIAEAVAAANREQRELAHR